GSDKTSLAFSIDASAGLDGAPRAGELRLSRREADQARVLAARIATELAPGLRVGFAYAEAADGLVAQLQGQERPAFMIAPEAPGETGAIQLSDVSLAVRRQLGRWGLTFSAERGRTLGGASARRAAEMSGRRLQENVATYGAALDRRFGSAEVV